MIRGIIFDLDGTLVDSALDFDLMRREMQLPDGLPILEALTQLPQAEREAVALILARHERQGVERAEVYPGVLAFLAEVDRRALHRAILTRNSRPSTLATLSRCELNFPLVFTREDGPTKPDPAGILHICQSWNIAPAECLMIGDYWFDIAAGQAAGTRTVLFCGSGGDGQLPADVIPDFTLDSFAHVVEFWSWFKSL